MNYTSKLFFIFVMVNSPDVIGNTDPMDVNLTSPMYVDLTSPMGEKSTSASLQSPSLPQAQVQSSDNTELKEEEKSAEEEWKTKGRIIKKQIQEWVQKSNFNELVIDSIEPITEQIAPEDLNESTLAQSLHDIMDKLDELSNLLKKSKSNNVTLNNRFKSELQREKAIVLENIKTNVAKLYELSTLHEEASRLFRGRSSWEEIISPESSCSHKELVNSLDFALNRLNDPAKNIDTNLMQKKKDILVDTHIEVDKLYRLSRSYDRMFGREGTLFIELEKLVNECLECNFRTTSAKPDWNALYNDINEIMKLEDSKQKLAGMMHALHSIRKYIRHDEIRSQSIRQSYTKIYDSLERTVTILRNRTKLDIDEEFINEIAKLQGIYLMAIFKRFPDCAVSIFHKSSLDLCSIKKIAKLQLIDIDVFACFEYSQGLESQD